MIESKPTQRTFATLNDEVPRYLTAVAREARRVELLQTKADCKRVNEALWKMGRIYYESVPLVEIASLLRANGFEFNDVIATADEGRLTRPVGRDKWLSLSYFKMPSGRFEVVAYVN